MTQQIQLDSYYLASLGLHPLNLNSMNPSKYVHNLYIDYNFINKFLLLFIACKAIPIIVFHGSFKVCMYNACVWARICAINAWAYVCVVIKNCVIYDEHYYIAFVQSDYSRLDPLCFRHLVQTFLSQSHSSS